VSWSLGSIVIIGVEVGEVCIGIGFPGKLWVEVLISFLQKQIVFVEGLQIRKRNRWREERRVNMDLFPPLDRKIKAKKQKKGTTQINGRLLSE